MQDFLEETRFDTKFFLLIVQRLDELKWAIDGRLG